MILPTSWSRRESRCQTDAMNSFNTSLLSRGHIEFAFLGWEALLSSMLRRGGVEAEQSSIGIQTGLQEIMTFSPEQVWVVPVFGIQPAPYGLTASPTWLGTMPMVMRLCLLLPPVPSASLRQLQPGS